MSNTVNHTSVTGTKLCHLLKVLLALQFSELLLFVKKQLHLLPLLIVNISDDQVLYGLKERRGSGCPECWSQDWGRRTHDAFIDPHTALPPVRLLGVCWQ